MLRASPRAKHISAFAGATMAGGLLVTSAAWAALKKFRQNMNVMMALPVTGAWNNGQGAEAASIVFLLSLSELLESWAAGRASTAVNGLLKLLPVTSIVRGADGTDQEMPVEKVIVDRKILILCGSRIPFSPVRQLWRPDSDNATARGHSPV